MGIAVRKFMDTLGGKGHPILSRGERMSNFGVRCAEHRFLSFETGRSPGLLSHKESGAQTPHSKVYPCNLDARRRSKDSLGRQDLCQGGRQSVHLHAAQQKLL